MAKDETKPLSADTLKGDKDALAAIKAMTGYASAKPEYELTKLTEADDDLKDAEAALTQEEARCKAARDAMVGAQWARHNAVLGAKQQVVAKFGDDS